MIDCKSKINSEFAEILFVFGNLEQLFTNKVGMMHSDRKSKKLLVVCFCKHILLHVGD